MKSQVAAEAVKTMNPDINVIAHQNRVGVETECKDKELQKIIRIYVYTCRNFVYSCFHTHFLCTSYFPAVEFSPNFCPITYFSW